jgi:hypothetical protein
MQCALICEHSLEAKKMKKEEKKKKILDSTQRNSQ